MMAQLPEPWRVGVPEIEAGRVRQLRQAEGGES